MSTLTPAERRLLFLLGTTVSGYLTGQLRLAEGAAPMARNLEREAQVQDLIDEIDSLSMEIERTLTKEDDDG